MQSTRRKSRLTPASHAHLAFITTTTLNASGQSTASITRKTNAEVFAMTKQFPNNTDLTVLPNGYFFHMQLTEVLLAYGVKVPTPEKLNVVLDSALFDRDDGYEIVDQFIDPSLIAMLDEQPTHMKVVGVNRSRTELFTYSFTNDGKKLSLLPEANPEHICTGISIYKERLPNKKISAILGCPALNSHYLIVAYEDGEIILGSVINKQFQKKFVLQDKAPNMTAMTLLGSPTGIIIAHHPELNHFKLFDLPFMLKQTSGNIMKGISTIKTETRLYNVHISPDGKHLSGLQYKDGMESDIVYCYDLKTRKSTIISMKSPIEDFVIGHDQHTAAIKQEDENIELNQPKQLYEPGTLAKLLSHEDKPVTIDKTPERRHQRSNSHLNRFLTRQHSSDEDLNDAMAVRKAQSSFKKG